MARAPELRSWRSALDWGRLLRLSLAPSAAADAAAGCVLGAGAWPGGAGPFLLLLGSLCVYHGGMILNDWADRDVDRRTRPERPLPSGRIAPAAALVLGLALLALGASLAMQAGRAPGILLGGVAVLAALYDLAGRGPWMGPLLLGLCRAGNLGAGVALGLAWRAEHGPFPLRVADPLSWSVLAIPLAYGSYVFVVSRLGRLEDGEEAGLIGRRPARLLAVASALLLVLPLLPVPHPAHPGGLEGVAMHLADHRIPLATLVAAGGAFGILRLAFRSGAWTRGGVMRAMGMALRRLIVFDAAVAMLVGTASGLAAGLCILLGLPLSFGLRRVFPPS